jgi:hypothetical protein
METIPLPLQAVLHLFSGPLADVRFGDVDARSLAALAADVQSTADAVAVAHATLEQARAALDERQHALVVHAQRALAYARVYAEGDDALVHQLESIPLPRPPRRPRATDEPLVLAEAPAAPRPRTRGRGRRESESLLPIVPVAPGLDEVAAE